MSLVAVAALAGAFAAAGILVRPAIARTGLGVWHPAVAWLALEAIFFGLGSAVLALDDRTGPALFVAGAVLVFGVGVAAADRVAVRRAAADASKGTAPAAEVRLPVAAALAVVAVAALAPILAATGIPALSGDITGSRTELVGLPVQLARVALPGLVLALVLPRVLPPPGPTRASSRTRPTALALAVLALVVLFQLGLASRYLPAELAAALLVGAGLAGQTVPARWLAIGTIAAVAAFAGIQVARAWDQAGARPLAFAAERTVNRIVLIQPRTLEALQEAIPAEQPYFGGLTWARRLGPVLGRDNIPNLGYWIYPRLFPGQAATGYAAPGLVGEAWANFGPAGIGLFGLFGVAVERLGAFLARRRSGADLVAGALAIVFAARTHALGVNGLAVLLSLTLAWRLLSAGGWRELLADVRSALAWRS